MKKFLFVIVVATLAACHQNTDTNGVKEVTIKDTCAKYHLIDEISARIKFENLSACNILFSEHKGSYQQHPDAFPKLMEYAYKNYHPIGVCMGLYPDDPDAIAEVDLKWKVGIRVLPLKQNGQPSDFKSEDPFAVNATMEELSIPVTDLTKPKSPYELETLPKVSVIYVVTTVEKAGIDGLAMNAWLTINGYVQTGTTRMEFAMQKVEPMKMPVKISIPVVKRKSGLSLLK
jgi:hypothetical protein